MRLWAITNKAAVNIHLQVSLCHMLSFLLGKFLAVDKLGHVVDVYLTSKETIKL